MTDETKDDKPTESPVDFRSMAADTMGRDLLQALVQELKLLPKPWQEMAEGQQNDIIDRLRNRVMTNVGMAVHLMAARGRIVVPGELDSVTIKDGVKAVVKFGLKAENLDHLYEAAGHSVLVVIANAADHLGGIGEVKGESDQRGLDLGHEYHENDGGGMEGTVIDGTALPAPDDDPVIPQEEIDKAYEWGRTAAADGKSQDDCPIMAGVLCIAWVKGWKDWHEENPQGGAA